MSDYYTVYTNYTDTVLASSEEKSIVDLIPSLTKLPESWEDLCDLIIPEVTMEITYVDVTYTYPRVTTKIATKYSKPHYS